MSALRFAVLWHHEVDEPHYDLMFETAPGSQLATWRCAQWPIYSPLEAKRLKDHRRVFLDFEGELEGSRGKVRRITVGGCEIIHVGPGEFVVQLSDGMQSFRLGLEQIDTETWRIIP